MNVADEAPTIAAARTGLEDKRWSVTELVEATLARIEQLDPELNAYLHLDPELALAAARAAEDSRVRGPLHGIPICVKDVIDVAGLPTTAGAAGWRRDPAADAGAVSRLRAAGAIVLGKGNTNEFAYGIDGRNPHWGDCKNPYDRSRISGGSSAGPAVATATGMALAGLGTDTTGSVRVPASLCGLVGVRPTLGTVPLGGVVPLAWSYDTVGPLARTAEDAWTLLAVLRGEPLGTAEPVASADEGLAGLRIGLCEELITLADEQVAQRLRRVATGLAAAGASVEPMPVPDLERASAMHRLIQSAEAATVHSGWFGEQRERYAADVRTRLEAGRLLGAELYLRAQRERRRFIEDFAAAFSGFDLALAPTTLTTAPHRDAAAVEIRGQTAPMRAALLSCTLPISQLDCPAVSVPAGLLDGLPIGVQLIGRPGSEAPLLRVAAAIEADGVA